MTVSSSLNRKDYNGDGVTTAFAFPFLFFQNSHLVVIETVVATGLETVLTLGTHYTVTGAANPAGGTVTRLAAPATGTRLTILRQVPATQESDYIANDPFPAETLEQNLDLGVMLDQQLAELDNRALHFPRGDIALAELPSAAARASKFLGFDAAGNAIIAASTNVVVAGGPAGLAANNIFTGLNTFFAAESVITVKSTDGTPAAMTHSGQKYLSIFRNTGLDGNDIYDPIFPSVEHYDVLQGVLEIASGSTIEHAAAVSGYVKSADDASAGGGTNGVALFGCGLATVDNAAVWGINTLLMDAATRTLGAGTGRILVNELDFNVMNPGTQVIGLSIGGNSLAQPTNALGFIVNTLGNGNKWVTGFVTMDAAADFGLALGALAASGTNINSQPAVMTFFDNGSVRRSMQMQVQPSGGTNFLVLSVSGSNVSVKATQGNFLVDSGFGFIVNGLPVVGARKAGWAVATNTKLRTTFDTTTVTLPQLAARVGALIDDLFSSAGHGLIGA